MSLSSTAPGYDFWANKNTPVIIARSVSYCIKPPELAWHTIYMEVNSTDRQCELTAWWWDGLTYVRGESFKNPNPELPSKYRTTEKIWTYLKEWELVEKVYHNPEDYHYKATKKLTGPDE